MSATKRKTTHAEHRVNHLKKQVLGHQRLIGDLQEALRTFQERALGAEREVELAWGAVALLEHVARRIAAELPEERREAWAVQYPWLETKEKTHGTDPTR